jgi:hypothetical protein
MGLVTVNGPPVTAGGFVTSSHATGGVRLGVDCSVNPVALVGQERIRELPLAAQTGSIVLRGWTIGKNTAQVLFAAARAFLW